MSEDSTIDNGEAGGVKPAEWGLMPASKVDFRHLLRYWFVKYNPLYFASAFCVFTGIYFTSSDLQNQDQLTVEQGRLALFAVIQAYELLLVAGAVLLIRRGGNGRAASILALLQILFLYDASFRIESVAYLGMAGTIASALWAFVTALKLWLLNRVLQLDLPIAVVAIAAAGAAGIPVMIQILSHELIHPNTVYLAASWFGAGLLVLLRYIQPALISSLAVKTTDQIKVRRALIGVASLLGFFYYYHLVNHILWVGVAEPSVIFGQVSVLLLVSLFVVEREISLWTIGICAGAFTIGTPSLASLGALLVAAIWIYRVASGSSTRLLVGAVLLGYLAVHAVSWWGSWEPYMLNIGGLTWQNLLLVAGLIYVGWKYHEPLAWLVLAAGLLYFARDFIDWVIVLMPDTALGRGLLLLGTGFVALIGGIAVNWWQGDPFEEEIDDSEER